VYLLSDAIKEHPEQFLTIKEYNSILRKREDMNAKDDQVVKTDVIPVTPTSEFPQGTDIPEFLKREQKSNKEIKETRKLIL